MLNTKFLIKPRFTTTPPFLTNNKPIEGFYFRELLLRGVGFKFAVLKNFLFARLGFSHYLSIQIPTTLNVKIRKDRLLVFGSNLNQVMTFSKLMRDIRPPDSYKFKGVSYAVEPVVVKVGKQR